MATIDEVITGVVRHPVAMAVKAAWRDLRWRLNRPALATGDLPMPPATMLFVCQGNICRSPFAARYAERRLRELGVEQVVCRSAGYRTTQAAASPPQAIVAAHPYGVDLAAHRPLPFADQVGDVDVVVAMEAKHLAILAGLGVPRERLVLLPRFAPPAIAGTGYRRDNIDDPFGWPLATFERCYAQTAAAVDGLVARLHEAARDGSLRQSIAYARPIEARPQRSR
jgi:protein-tyrosine phosphatase